MRFKARLKGVFRNRAIRIGCAALAWLFLVSTLHYYLNFEHEDRRTLKIGYMPVVANLAAPLLDFASQNMNHAIRFQAIKFASFSEMGEAFRNEQIQAAFIIAPLSIVLAQQGVNVRVVFIGNRHESTLVVRKGLNVTRLRDLYGHKIAVPIRYSGHHLALRRMIKADGLEGKIAIIEMNPPDMAAALATGSLDAYFVGEPFAAMTLKPGDSNLLFYVEQIQPDFICNLMIVGQKLIDEEEAAVLTLVESAARAGIWAKENRLEAAKICSRYWGQPTELVEYALSTPPDRIIFDKFVPDCQELKSVAEEMVEFGLIQNSDIEGLVENRFAVQADLSAIEQSVSSIIKLR